MSIVKRDLKKKYLDHCLKVVESGRRGIFDAPYYDQQNTFLKECEQAYRENKKSNLFRFALKDFN